MSILGVLEKKKMGSHGSYCTLGEALALQPFPSTLALKLSCQTSIEEISTGLSKEGKCCPLHLLLSADYGKGGGFLVAPLTAAPLTFVGSVVGIRATVQSFFFVGGYTLLL